ncbi:MAG: LolA-like putative outer membrane lipoprotein chaperone [Rikenellaceae bacterium]
MKKFLVYILLFLPFIGLCDKQSQILLEKVSSSIKELGDYKVEFEMSFEGMNPLEGDFGVSGDKYFFSMDNSSVICDGKTSYQINHSEKEVNIDNADAGLTGINPSKLFNINADDYHHSIMGANQLSLVPKDAGLGIGQIVLHIDNQEFLPTKITYVMLSGGEKIEILVEKIIKLNSKAKVLFQYDKKAFKDYEIIDFR